MERTLPRPDIQLYKLLKNCFITCVGCSIPSNVLIFVSLHYKRTLLYNEFFTYINYTIVVEHN